VRESEGDALRLALPPEATAAGLGVAAVTEKVWAAGFTVSVVESLSEPPPLHAAETVRVTVRSASEVFAGAV
jgi:hypothetical protein